MRGLAITRTAIEHPTSSPVTYSLELKYNPVRLGPLTPPAFERARLLVGVNEWTG